MFLQHFKQYGSRTTERRLEMKSLWKSFFTAVFFLFILTNAATGDEPLPKARQTPLPESEFKAHFHPIPFAQVTGKRFSVGPFLITGGNREHYNSMTAGWGGFGVLWSKPVATIYVRTERFTYRFLEAEPVFTLSFYPSSCNKAILTVYGRKSGRDTDKEKNNRIHPGCDAGRRSLLSAGGSGSRLSTGSPLRIDEGCRSTRNCKRCQQPQLSCAIYRRSDRRLETESIKKCDSDIRHRGFCGDAANAPFPSLACGSNPHSNRGKFIPESVLQRINQKFVDVGENLFLRIHFQHAEIHEEFFLQRLSCGKLQIGDFIKESGFILDEIAGQHPLFRDGNISTLQELKNIGHLLTARQIGSVLKF